MILYGDPRSGNCQKVAFTAAHLGLPLRWHQVDVMGGETRSPEFLALNPAGQVPVVVFDDGRFLSQSNAILLYLAEGTDLLPVDPWMRAKVHQWMFWEQYSHEPTIAVIRFQRQFLGWPAERIDADLMSRGEAALDLMERHLATREWLVGSGLTAADVALVAYTRWAGEGGFDLDVRPALRAWVSRVEAAIPIRSG